MAIPVLVEFVRVQFLVFLRPVLAENRAIRCAP